MAEYEAVKDTLWAGPQPIVVGIKETGEVIWKNTVVPPKPTVNAYITIEGAMEDGETWMSVLQFIGDSDYPIQSVIGAGLEYSTEDVPTTWQDFPTERLWEDDAYAGLHFEAPDIPSKIHLRAKDGGNTNVWGLTIEAQKVSGPILSLLDNTLSLTELPEEAFFHQEPE